MILSGFASIYFERVLKSVEETYSVWDRNFQLAFWSAAIYLPILIYDNPTNPFVGWSYVAVCHSGFEPRASRPRQQVCYSHA